MIARVGLYHEPRRKLPWLVSWWSDPDPDTGKQRKFTKSFRYKAEALDFQAAKQTELNQGGQRERPQDVTLDRLLKEYIESRLKSLSHSSQVCYGIAMEQLKTFFRGDRKIRAIEQRHAEAFMSTIRRKNGHPEPLSSHTKAQRLKLCRAIFGAAMDWGYIDRNPFLPTRISGSSGVLRAKGIARSWHHLTPSEFTCLLSHVPSVHRRASFWLMYGCGLRPGEVYNLTIDNVDLANRRVHVESRKATEKAPPFTVKADDRSSDCKARSVPIPEAAMADLTEAVHLAFKSGGFIALTPERLNAIQANWSLCRDGKPWGGRSKHRPWQNRDMVNNLLRDTKGYVRKAGIRLGGAFTLHTFRKSFAQNHADAGTPPKTLAKLLGHSDVSVTLEFYNRVTDSNEREAAKTLDRIFSSVQTSQIPQRDAV